MEQSINLRFYMDDTSIPYEPEDNPFPRNNEADEFDQMIIRKYELDGDNKVNYSEI